jgi:hypothetical protein
MKIQPYIEKLNSSPEYKKFMKENSDAFLVAGFFVIDLETKQNIHQIDFYIPSKKKFAAFTLDGGIQVQIMDTMNKKAPEKLDMNTNVDLDALEGILEDEMKNRNITSSVKKIIAVLQSINGKKVWNINSVLSGMEILKAHVEDDSQTVLKMEKQSLMDIMKKIPPEQLKAMQQGAKEAQSEELGSISSDEAEDQIKKLDKLEEDIEKEKARLKKASKSKVKKK